MPERPFLKNRGVPGSIPGLAIQTGPKESPQTGDFLAELQGGASRLQAAVFALGVQFGVQNRPFSRPCKLT